MTYRTTQAAVQAIVKTKSTIDLDPFIEVANALVTDVCSNSSYSDAKLELIERWLAAHFYQIRDTPVDTQKAGPVSQKFQYKVGFNLAQTRYGQQAMLIDTDGNLAALSKRSELGKKRSISVVHLGTVTTEGDDDTT